MKVKPPKIKLSVLARKLQQQRPQLYKSVLGSSPDEDVISSSETMPDRRTMQRTKV
jgi:hypothetical protein